ncbi:MAG: FecR domain-containing protein [Pirellulaceae bacterium]|nr:FecR domain-containing protein [Pirellulaceae bacterium]
MNESERPSPELRRLVSLACDGELSPEEHALLQAILLTDASARAFYRECMLLHGELAWSDVARRAAAQTPPACLPLPLDPCQGPEHPLLDSLGAGFQQMLGFFGRPVVFSLLLALIIPGIVLTLFAINVAMHPPEYAALPPVPAPAPAPATMPAIPAPMRGAVARIARTDRCVWGEAGQNLSAGTTLLADQRLELNEGLVEVVFDDGASTIVEGPSVFETKQKGGFLHRGRLVARVPKGAEGFAVETPTATVVDYGTEFGVAVEEGQAMAEVHVFKGEVALETRSEEAATSINRERLTAGMAARVETVGANGTLAIRPIAPSDERFVRSMPSEAEAAIVAHFADGNGRESVDQYPGVLGDGWATEWEYRETEEIDCDLSVEQSDPLLGGGDYLRLLAERKLGTNMVQRALERHLEITDRVDLTKSHVVSFDFRIDRFAGFTTRNDYVILCSNAIPEAAPRPRLASGWHVCFYGNGHGDDATRRWLFMTRDEKGESRKVDSRVPVVEGSVYSFRILVEPEAPRWTPSISVDGGPWTHYEAMQMRSGGSAQEFNYWPILASWWKLDGDSANDEREALGFSIDSVRISPADEAADPK